jgi:hypothetical protein
VPARFGFRLERVECYVECCAVCCHATVCRILIVEGIIYTSTSNDALTCPCYNALTCPCFFNPYTSNDALTCPCIQRPDVPLLLQSLHPAALDQTGNLSRWNALDYSRAPVAPPRLKVSYLESVCKQVPAMS